MRISDAAAFGSYIRARRKALNYTQSFISEASGLSISFISDVENGKPTVELEKTIKLANLLGINIFMEDRD